VSSRELDAAAIQDPALRRAFAAARSTHARHGRSYFLATRLLPAAKRPHIHALYGFARYADDLVDRLGPTRPGDPAVRTAARRLDELQASVVDGGASSLPVVAAVRETMRRFDLPARHVADFLGSMRADLTVAKYATYADLERYMWGSGAVIGLLLLPILGTAEPEVAAPYAADLGVAFQLTNFIRDVGEDLRRGRIYLPTEDLAAFGVDCERLRGGVVDGPVRRLLAYEIARAREIYRNARPGIRLLHPASRPCVLAAYRLYAGILDEIERADYRVLDRRVRVPGWRRAAVAAPAVAARALDELRT
jgi:phytoene synthase